MDKEKNQKQENMQDQDQSESSPELTKNQVILYCIIIGGSVMIFILAMIGINIFALLIIIGVVLVYVYFDKDLQNGDNKDKNNQNS
ncbi:MAG: hypothetical protein ACTSP6_08765 [Promethearchaeota archaeon]